MSVNFNSTDTQGIFKEFEYKTTSNPDIKHTSGDYKLKEQLKSDKFDYSKNDGKISFKDKLINFGKGIIAPITNMFKSPKNLIIGVGSIAGITALTIATGGAIAPLLVTAGIAGGAVQLGISAYKAHTATTDDEAKKAWQGIGTGTSAIAGSIAGAKAAAKGGGIQGAENMNPLKATWACIKNAPKAVSKSFKAFTSGEFLVNLGIKKPAVKQEEVQMDKPSEQTAEPKPDKTAEQTAKQTTEPKPEAKAEPKPEAKAEPKPEAKAEPKPDQTAEQTIKQTAEPKPDQTAEQKAKQTAEPKPHQTAEQKAKQTAEPKPDQTVEQTAEPKASAQAKTKTESITPPEFEKMFSNISEKPDICPEGQIVSHHGVDGENTFIRRGAQVQKRMIKEKITKQDLSQGERKNLEFYLEQTKILDDEFAKLKPLENDCVVYRGNPANSFFSESPDFKIIEEAKIGDIIVPDEGYSYTTDNIKYAKIWADGRRGIDISGNLKRVLHYKIKIPKGAKVSRNLEHGGEVLMPRGAQYKLLSKETGNLGDIFVTMEYILPEG